MIAIVVAVFFASLAIVAIQISRALCAHIEPADDGPPPGTPPYVVLPPAAALVGVALVMLHAGPLELGIAAMVLFALVACWCSDAMCGIVPDVFTLVPLAALVLFAVAQRNWTMALSAPLVFAPFAAAAFLTRGRGMGWGDAKLVALCGVALGAPLAFLTLAVACAAAAIAHRFTSVRRPIAFAPYIAALTVAALPLGLTQ